MLANNLETRINQRGIQWPLIQGSRWKFGWWWRSPSQSWVTPLRPPAPGSPLRLSIAARRSPRSHPSDLGVTNTKNQHHKATGLPGIRNIWGWGPKGRGRLNSKSWTGLHSSEQLETSALTSSQPEGQECSQSLPVKSYHGKSISRLSN